MKKPKLKSKPQAGAALPEEKGFFEGRLPLLAALCLAALVFLPALGADFLDWDDDFNFLNNPHFRGLGWANLKWMFTTFLGGPYQPLTWLSLGLDHAFWGMRPAGYHLTNLLLHLLNAGLFYFIVERLLRAAFPGGERRADLAWGAAFAAAIFAAHPLRVESVAWITERRDVLSGAFYLASLLCYLKAAAAGGEQRARELRRAFWLFCAALLSKAIGVGYAFALLALDVLVLERSADPATPEGRAALSEKIPFLLAGLAAGAAGYFGQSTSAVVAGLSDFGPAERLAQAAYGLAHYAQKTLLPAGLLPIYEVPKVFSPAAPRFLLAGAASLAALAFVWVRRRRWPGLAAAAAFYLVFLAPVLGFVKMGAHFAADRYSYMACLGWAALGGWLFVRLAGDRAWRGLVLPAAGLLAAVYAGLAWSYAGHWKNSEALWTYVTPRAPGSALAFNNLGDVHFRARRFPQASAAYARALTLRPDFAFVSYNLANSLLGEGRWDLAERQYLETLRVQPAFPAALGNYGNLLADQGRYAEAEARYRASLALKPDNADVLSGMGEIFLRQGRLADAVGWYQRSLAVKPDTFSSAANLALTLHRLRRWQEAEPWFQAAVRIGPDRAIAHDNYGNFLLDQGRYPEAVARYQEALRLDQSRPETWNNIGAALLRQGRAAEAAPYFRKALELNPAMEMARRSLAAALAAGR